MAERRMFAKTIIDSDAFLDMPLSTQALYFHLAMRADDDGFINNPKKIQRMIGASDDDCKILLMKRFILAFESGVIVIKHWKIHNYIQKDRYKPTIYQDEKALLTQKDNRAYTEDTGCIQDVSAVDTQDRLGEVSIGKVSIGEDITGDSPEPPPPPPKPKKEKPVFKKYGVNGWVKLTDEQYNRLIADLGEVETMRCIEYIDESAQLTGNKNKWKDWNLVIRRCSRDGWGLKQVQGYGKKEAPKGASGQLGQAELEAIQKVLGTPYVKQEITPDFEAQAEEARRKIQELGSL